MEYSPEYYPQEVGLDRLCKMDKEFLNRPAAAETLAKPTRETLVLLALDKADTDASNADANGGKPIFKNWREIGRVTSSAYGYSVGQSLASKDTCETIAGSREL